MTILKSFVPMLLVLLVCLFETGCSTLDSVSDSAPPIANSLANGMYAVNVFPAYGEDISFKGQIRGNMTVQNALEESRSLKSTRNAEIKLYRIVQGSGRTVKMPVEMQSNGQSVKFEHDYALYPGDRLVIRGNASSGLGKILNQVLSRDSE